MADAVEHSRERLGRRLFTSGAIFLLLLGAVHSFSFIERIQANNDTERQLIALMTNYKFNFMGSLRSMDNLMTGFSIAFMLAALALGALALIIRRERPQLVKRVALVTALWLAAMTAVSFHYFFAAPTSFLAVTLVLFSLSWLFLPSPLPPSSQ
jgi:hypothetical protein